MTNLLREPHLNVCPYRVCLSKIRNASSRCKKSLSTEVSMPTAEKKSLLVRHPVLSFYLMSCAFFWALLILFGAVVVGALHVDPNAQPWTVWIVTILGSW